MAVDSAFALYLQSAERIYVAVDAPLTARWGGLARTYEASSCLSNEADAIAEAGRQIAFMGGPLTEDLVTVAGVLDVAAYRGRCITVAGIVLFVLGGDCDQATAITHFNVLRRL